jgi:formylglycine-generating enzyme required for sulfatase activity
VQNPLVAYPKWEVVKDEESQDPIDSSVVFVVRGGTFGNLYPSIRSAARNYARPNDCSYFLGLRVARTLR